jgi:hypothetical protein
MHVANSIIRLPIRPSPYTRSPRKPASRKKAVTTSIAMMTPTIGPTSCAKRPQLRPNSNVSTIPDTTPSAKPMPKIRRQKRNMRNHTSSSVRMYIA